MGIGERDTDSVLLRSFSALNLSLLAAHDLEAPFLDEAGFDRLLRAALDYLAAERDLRGWGPEAGWYHAAAHTADLLKFLARSPRLTVDDQRAILAGVADRLAQTDGYVFAHGEDERLASALLSILSRDDLDVDAFEACVQDLGTRHRRGATRAFDPVRFAGRQNARDLLRHLFVRLSSYPDLPAPLVAIRGLTLETLNAM